MSKKTLFAIITFTAIFSTPFFLPTQVKASDQVTLNVSVLARKSSDTINDFDFTAINGAIMTNNSITKHESKNISEKNFFATFFEKTLQSSLIQITRRAAAIFFSCRSERSRGSYTRCLLTLTS